MQLGSFSLIYSKVKSLTSSQKQKASAAFNYRPLITSGISIRNKHKQKSAAGRQRRATSNESLLCFDVDVYFLERWHRATPLVWVAAAAQSSTRKLHCGYFESRHPISSQIDFELKRFSFARKVSSWFTDPDEVSFIFSYVVLCLFLERSLRSRWVSACRSCKIRIKGIHGHNATSRELSALEIYFRRWWAIDWRLNYSQSKNMLHKKR